MSLLVVHCGGIGDFLIAAPLFHRHAAGRAWDIAGHPERGALAVAAGWARRALSLDTLDFTSIYTALSGRLCERLLDYDEVLVWLGDDSASEARCRAAGLPHVRFFPALPPADWSRHAAEFYAAQLGLPDADPMPFRVDGVLRHGQVMIHPGSGGRAKNWQMGHFEDLTDALVARGHHVTWLHGPAEEDLTYPEGIDTRSISDLVALGQTLSGAALYVGNDSGITHLAAAVGCPTLAIFLNSNPAVWRPRGERVVIVDGTESTALARVIGTARQILADAPRINGD